jgi:hypothetical protein
LGVDVEISGQLAIRGESWIGLGRVILIEEDTSLGKQPTGGGQAFGMHDVGT